MSDWINEFFWPLLKASGDAAVIALAVGGILLLAGRRIHPAWRHGFWLLVAIRLILPVLPSSPMSWKHWVPETGALADEVAAVTTVGESGVQYEEPRKVVGAAPVKAEPRPLNVQVVRGDQVTTPETSKAHPPSVGAEPRETRNWKDWLGIVWLGGTAISGVLILLAVVNFQRKLLRCERGTSEDEQSIARLLEEVCGELGIRRIPNVWITAAVESPALTGLLGPRILLPLRTAAELKPNELRYVLMHELAHLRRMDLWTNWGLCLLQAIHWFNPLVWWAFYRSRIEAERATDDWVMHRISDGVNKEYGEALLRLLELKTTVKGLSPGVLGVVESSRDLRFRLGAVGRFSKRGSWAMVAVASLLM